MLFLFLVLTGTASGQLLPQISLSPQNVAVGSGELKLTVSGQNFTPGLQVMWNGQLQATQFVDAHTIKATIPAGSVAQPALVPVSLTGPSGAVASGTIEFFVYVPLQSNYMIYDPQRTLIYVSVSKRDPNGPSMAMMNPQTGFIQRYVTLPDEPGVLAISSDSRYLYVALPTIVRRIDLTGATSDLDVSLSLFFGGPVTSIFPLPSAGSSAIIATSVRTYVFDGSQPRTAFGNGVPCLLGSLDGSTVYGGSLSGLFMYTVTANGLTTASQGLYTGSAYNGSACPILAGGLIYDPAGNVIDPSGPSLVNRFAAWGLVLPAPQINQTYFVGTDGNGGNYVSPEHYIIRFKAFSNTSGQLVTSLQLPVPFGVTYAISGSLISWGTNGLAFTDFPITSGSGSFPTKIFLFQAPTQ